MTGSSGGPVPLPEYATYFEDVPCAGQKGRCFDATIGDRPVTVIAEKARHEQITREARSANSAARHDVYWEVQGEVDGRRALEVQISANALGMKSIGHPKQEPELMIYPLENQDLQSREEITESSNTFINGRPVTTMQNTLTGNSLPRGRYIMAITYWGLSLDRKYVLVTVK